jgi:hypothetical protein
MRLLTHRDEADLRFVFAALAQRVRPENDGRRESALVALERCATDLGVPEPTTRGYADWRESSDAHRGAPSVQQIRTASDGSWTRAVHAMPQVPGTDLLVRRLTARGPKFTKTECIAALKRWHAETGDNITGSYKIWARRARQADPHARVPVCCDAAGDWFGSWVGALDAAGIELTRGGPRRGRPQRVRNVTRDEAVASVRMAYNALGEPFTQPRYDQWVRRKAAEHGDSPAPFRLCSGAVVCAMHQRRELRGIGPGIEARLRELVQNGEIAERAELERELSPELVGLGRYPGLTATRRRPDRTPRQRSSAGRRSRHTVPGSGPSARRSCSTRSPARASHGRNAS